MLKVFSLIVLDYFFIYSCTFVVLYLALLLLASCIPLKWRIAPSSLGIPLVAVLSAALMGTSWEPFATSTLRWITLPVFSADQSTTDVQHLVLLTVWLGGIAASALFSSIKSFAFIWLVRDGDDVQHDPEFVRALEKTGMRRAVRLKQSPAFRSVASWGVFRAYVLVPEDFRRRFTAPERYALYLHELTHIKKRDSLKCLLAGMVTALFWFNPISFHALRRFRSHIEVACDRAVIKLGIDAAAYADLIGRFIAAKRNGIPALHFSSAYKDAARRFRYIFGDASFLPEKEDRRMALLCLTVFGLAALLAPAFPRENPDTFPKSGQTVEREFASGEVVKEYYVFVRQGVIGTFSRSRVVARGFAMPGNLALPQSNRPAPSAR